MPLVVLSDHEIGSGRSGPIFAAIIQDKKVAIKIANISKRHDQQGRDIPILKRIKE